MRITTFFPFDLPHLPLAKKIARDALSHQAGKTTKIDFDGISVNGTILDIHQVKGGFECTIDISDADVDSIIEEIGK